MSPLQVCSSLLDASRLALLADHSSFVDVFVSTQELTAYCDFCNLWSVKPVYWCMRNSACAAEGIASCLPGLGIYLYPCFLVVTS